VLLLVVALLYNYVDSRACKLNSVRIGRVRGAVNSLYNVLRNFQSLQGLQSLHSLQTALEYN
jgi:hypothetical protein